MIAVELIETPKEIADASVKQYLADCVSVVRNAQPKDNERLFDRLMKESFGGKPSRVFEFLPCTIYIDSLPLRAQMVFGFMDWDSGLYRTNARELINWGWKWELILKAVDFTDYQAVKVKAPYFIYGQMSTHTQITSVSHSQRYTDAGLGYWMPEEVERELDQDEWNSVVLSYSPSALKEVMKETYGIKRREIYARGADMLEYRVYSLGGYTNNPNAWPHFINQRGHDPHTQKETREVAEMIEEALKCQ